MLGFLLSFFSGPFKDISNDLKEAFLSKQNAKTEQERINADKWIEDLKARRDIILEAQRGRIEQYVRPLFALPWIVYNLKVVIWDKVLGWGVTDGLSPELNDIQMIILTGYFLVEGIRIIKR